MRRTLLGAVLSVLVMTGSCVAPRGAEPEPTVAPAETSEVRTARVCGQVLDESGNAVEGASVVAARLETRIDSLSMLRLAEAGPPLPVVGTALTGSGGRFEITGLATGLYEVVARQGAATLAIAPAVDVSEGSATPVRLVLRTLHRIAGRVVRGDGESAARLEVSAFPFLSVLEPFLGSSLRFSACTGADGAFEIGGLPAGAWRFVVRGAGWRAALTAAESVPAHGSIEISLGGDARLVGRVTGPDARAVAGAHVALYDDDSLRVTTSRPDGSYELPALSDHDAYVAVLADGFAPWPDRLMLNVFASGDALMVRRGRNVLNAELVRGCVVRGTVVAREGGAPQVGVRVTAFSFHAVLGWAPSTVTDAEGRFELRGIPGSATSLVATKPGWTQRGAPESIRNLGDARCGTPDGGIVLAGEGAEVRARLEIDEAPVVRGRVVGPDGAAVPFATVRAGEHEASEGERGFIFGRMSCTAGPDGRFAVPLCAAFDSVDVVASAPGFHPGEAVVSAAPGSSPPEVEVRLRRGASVEGRILSEDGDPIEGMLVTITPARDRQGLLRPESVTTRTARDGTFVIADLDPGAWEVETERHHTGEGWRRIDAPEGGVVRTNLPLAQRVVRGRVLRADGTPAPGATVYLGNSMARAGPDGAFRFDHVLRREVVLNADASNAGPAPPVTLDATTDDVVLQLTQPLTIAGRVVWRGSGPVQGGHVRASRVTESATHEVQAPVGDDGTFRLEGVGSGAYHVSFFSVVPSWWRHFGPAADATAHGGAEDVLLEAEPGIRLAGRVVLDDGTPAPSGTVTLRRIAAPDEDPLLPGEAELVSSEAVAQIMDGAFARDALVPGTWRAVVRVPGARDQVVTVDPRPPWIAPPSYRPRGCDVVVRMCAGVTLRGRIWARPGTPAAGARVRLVSDGSDNSRSAIADSDGVFVVQDAPCGRIGLVADWRGPGGYACGAFGPVVELRHGVENPPVEFRLFVAERRASDE